MGAMGNQTETDGDREQGSSTISHEKAMKALKTVDGLVNGDFEPDTEEYDRLTEEGLTPRQREIVEKSADCHRMDVEDTSVPTFGDKLAAGKKIPTTFVYNGVLFAVKTTWLTTPSSGVREYSWHDEGYQFTFRDRSDRPGQISIRDVDYREGRAE